MDDISLQTLLTETAADLGIVGAQLAIYHGGSIREFVTGLRDYELALPVTADTLFQIGSTTKVFNAATIMTLIDEGVLELNRPVKEYIPAFRLANRDAQERVTLRHLLSMSSGVDNGPYYDYGRGDDALGRYVQTMSGIPQIFEPDTAFGYSNAGTCIAGYAAACATGRCWEQLLIEQILDPLSLRHTVVFAEDLLTHPLALGYTRTDSGIPQRITRWELPRCKAPSGGTLCSSAGDLVRFAHMLLRHGNSPEGHPILSLSSVAQMQAPQVSLPCKLIAEKWCVGPYLKRWGGVTLYGHSGTQRAGSSTLLWSPDRDFAIATVVNVAEQGYPFADRLFNVVFPALIGVDKPHGPSAEDTVPVQVALEPYTGRYEDSGAAIHIALKDGKLFGSIESTAGGWQHSKSTIHSELIPLGGTRFLPRDSTFGGNRGWDVGFWGNSKDGAPTHFLNGLFAYRRTG
jgi:CubicO group peptidase (beta-lactamase class C family)